MSVISKELKFYKTLPLKARVLVFSFVLRSVASPIFSLFINSFIWRTTSSFFNVAIYNLGFFIFLPLGFYINGLLLKKIKINILYLVGLFVSTLTALVIIFFSGKKRYLTEAS